MMKQRSQPISARIRILGALLAVAVVGLMAGGGVAVALDPVTGAAAAFAVAAGVATVAIAVTGWFVVGRLLAPIRRLRETANAITLDDLGARLPDGGKDDMAAVTRTVNAMLDRLQDSLAVQRQLLDDVRHELKTPITIVRGHLEMMDATSPADVESIREIGIAELDRMIGLVDDIDLLAAVEGDQFAMGQVDLGALTTHLGELVAAIPGHTWQVEARAEGVIEGDADRLLQAWLQLADNAAKYTPQGTPIEVGSAADETGATLWVRDHGHGIPAASRQRIFRRFGRAPRRQGDGGSGLGLAIVDTIARAHRGSCAVTDTPGGGATFSLHVPLRLTDDATALPSPVRVGDVLHREAVQ